MLTVMRNSTILPIVAASLLCNSPLKAEPTENNEISSSGVEIQVIGRRLSEAEVREQANDFVRRSGIANKSDPVARWIDPVCPKVVGIKPEYAQIVEKQMRDIAKLTGIRAASDTCAANIVVSFTTNGQGVVQQIAKRSPTQMAELMSAERRQLLSSDAPVRW